MPEFNYERHEIQRVIDAGIADDETFYRLQVSGKVQCRTLAISTEQLAAIRDILAPTASPAKAPSLSDIDWTGPATDINDDLIEIWFARRPEVGRDSETLADAMAWADTMFAKHAR